jgi:lipopolysaccharide transport system permease protein
MSDAIRAADPADREANGLARTTLRPGRGWVAFDVAELLRFRDLLVVFAERDLKLRYRQTALGVSWVLIQPLMAAGLFSFVFGTVAGLKTEGVPYLVFSFAGLLAWNVFSSTLSKTSGSMVGNAYLITRVYFPRLILPLSMIGATLVDLLVSLGLMAVLLAAYHVTPGWSVLLLPVWTVLLLMMALGLGLIAAPLCAQYRDVNYVLPILIPFLLYASPVAYRVAHLPARYQPLFYVLNPLASLVEGFRASLIGGEGPALIWVAWSAAVAVLALLAGAAVFHRIERVVADVI